MIQRIQSLYLLLATAVMSLTLFLPIATISYDAQTYNLTAFGSIETIWIGILLSLAVLVPLVTIFLFKRRTLQIRLCAVEMVLLLGVLILYGLYYWFTIKSFENFTLDHLQFGWAAPMPVAALILTYLASRAIFKDEMLVRSLDRIR